MGLLHRYWRDLMTHEKGETATDKIEHKKRNIVKLAVTEMIPDCACNFAYKLDNGHIVVDDCDPNKGVKNGDTFTDENSWFYNVCKK